MPASLLKLLQNQIDITRVPFSDRGSRLLIYQTIGRNSLYIKLAERLIRLEPGLEDHLHRPPFIDDFHLLDQNGRALEFKAVTSAELIQLQTQIGTFGLVFHDANSLILGLPPRQICGIRFHVRSLYWRETTSGGELKRVHNLTYKTNGQVRINRFSPQEDGNVIELIVQAGDDCSISINIGDQEHSSDSVTPFSTAFRSAEARWQSWFDSIPPVEEIYRPKYAYAWWVMANNLVHPSGYINYEAMMPTKAFYVGVWLWDSALHALALRHVDPELARNQLRVMLTHQLPDGMLPDAIFDEGVVSEIDHPIHAKVTKPPLFAWAALKLHGTDPDIGFLKEIYDPLVKCNDWWLNANDEDEDGLVQYTHPYSSGLDNSPLWDYGMPVESPDINTYLNIQMNSLARIADILRRRDEADVWRRRAETLTKRMIEDFWDEEAGLFRALHDERPIPAMTPFNLYPLWTGQLPDNITKRLLVHLKDPTEFWGDYMLPTVARKDPAYDPERMWRGPVWANINYFFVEALQRVGEKDLARELRNKTLNLIMSQPGIYEYYNPETGEPPATAAPMFGWTAAVFIELALQATAKSSPAKTAAKEMNL